MNDTTGRAERYRVRAEEVRIIAASMKNSETRRILCEVADEYEHMAAQVERLKLDEFAPQKRKPGG